MLQWNPELWSLLVMLQWNPDERERDHPSVKTVTDCVCIMHCIGTVLEKSSLALSLSLLLSLSLSSSPLPPPPHSLLLSLSLSLSPSPKCIDVWSVNNTSYDLWGFYIQGAEDILMHLDGSSCCKCRHWCPGKHDPQVVGSFVFRP